MKICVHDISLYCYAVEDTSRNVMLSRIRVSGRPVLFQILKEIFQTFMIKRGVYYRDFSKYSLLK